MLTSLISEARCARRERSHRLRVGCSSRCRCSAPRSSCSEAGAPTGSGPLLATAMSWAPSPSAACSSSWAAAAPPTSARCDQTSVDWIPPGSFHVDVGLLVDQLSMTFVLLITFVGVADPRVLDRVHGARPATGAASSPT